MAKLLFIIPRTGLQVEDPIGLGSAIAKCVLPDHIESRVRVEIGSGNAVAIVCTPSDGILVRGACMAATTERLSEGWWRPAGPLPDGASAVFRCDEEIAELATDVVASRTIWYVQMEQYFAASTSQRALISLLADYQPNPNVLAWWLSAGTLGIGNSWDQRIKKLPRDSVLRLERSTWKFQIQTRLHAFSIGGNEAEASENYLAELRACYQRQDFDWKHWVIALSGGCDSRVSLHHLADRPGISTITWGLKESDSHLGTDAYIARQLAEVSGLPNQYFLTDDSSEDIQQLIDLILKATEGRTDNIAAAMDGLQRYRLLHDQGVQGLVRTDIMGSDKIANSVKGARIANSMIMLKDYADASRFGLTSILDDQIDQMQEFAESTPSQIRDRLYIEYRHACVLSGLSDARLCYFEQCNPLISRKLYDAFLQLSDAQRNKKALFKNFSRSLYPGIPFALRDSTKDLQQIFRLPRLRYLMAERFAQESSGQLPEACLRLLYKACTQAGESQSSADATDIVKFILAKLLPKSAYYRFSVFVRGYKRETMNVSELAYRAYSYLKMQDILKSDSTIIASQLLRLTPYKR